MASSAARLALEVTVSIPWRVVPSFCGARGEGDMATSKCGHCGESLFELKTIEPAGGVYKVNMVQCSACGAVVGAVYDFNAGVMLPAAGEEDRRHCRAGRPHRCRPARDRGGSEPVMSTRSPSASLAPQVVDGEIGQRPHPVLQRRLVDMEQRRVIGRRLVRILIRRGDAQKEEHAGDDLGEEREILGARRRARDPSPARAPTPSPRLRVPHRVSAGSL